MRECQKLQVFPELSLLLFCNNPNSPGTFSLWPSGELRAVRGPCASPRASPALSPRPRAPQSPSEPGRARASRPLPASIPPARPGRYHGNASFRPRLSQSRSGGGGGGPAPREISQWESAGGGGRSRRCLPAGPGHGGGGGELQSGPRAEAGWGRPPPARCLLAAPRGERSEGWAVLQTFYLRTHNSLQLTSPFWGCSRFLPFKEAFRDPFRDPAHKQQLLLSRRPGHF